MLGYNTLAKPAATKVTLTGEGTTLIPAAGFTTSYGYGLTGTLTSQQDPASGGLPVETITYGYDEFGEPTSVTGSGGASWDYVAAIGYSHLGQPLVYTLGPTTSRVAATLTYDQQTQNLTDVQTTDSTTSGAVDDLTYTYGNTAVSKGAGLLTSTTDQQNAAAITDTQCYAYDYAQRIQQAWTATDNCAATPAPGNSATVGGPLAPYWQSWTYDAAGNRATQTDHDPAGNTASDTTTTYNYPAQGSAADQPHTLTATTATGPAAPANTASYGYDTAGETTTITGGATGNQILTWNDQDQLASDQAAAGTTSYVYDASGNLVVRRDPGQTTLYTGDEQIVLNTANSTLTGTRYYAIGGTTIAARTSAGTVDYLIPDRQDTNQLAINVTTQAVTRRQYLPFGAARGATPPAWPGDNGYVGGSNDTATSLQTLGARQYDPAAGRFLSADPVFEAGSPQQAGGYDYAGNDPVTDSDPSGLNVRCLPGDADCGLQTKFANGGSFNVPPAPDMGSFKDLLGGIQNTVLGTLSAGLRGAECQAGCTTAALQPNLFDKAEANLTRAEHLDTHSEAYYFGQLGASLAAFLIPGAADSDAIDAAFGIIRRLATKTTAPEDAGIPAGSTADAATSGSRITPAVRGQYFEDGAEPPICSYCQQNPAEHLDHVIPRSQGGDLSPENLTPACSWCNLSKGARVAPVNPPPGFVGEWPPSFWPSRMLEWWSSTYGGS